MFWRIKIVFVKEIPCKVPYVTRICSRNIHWPSIMWQALLAWMTSSSWQLREMAVIPILQMRKSRLREVMWLAQTGIRVWTHIHSGPEFAFVLPSWRGRRGRAQNLWSRFVGAVWRISKIFSQFPLPVETPLHSKGLVQTPGPPEPSQRHPDLTHGFFPGISQEGHCASDVQSILKWVTAQFAHVCLPYLGLVVFLIPPCRANWRCSLTCTYPRIFFLNFQDS